MHRNDAEPEYKKPKVMAKRKITRRKASSKHARRKVIKRKELPNNFAYFPHLPADLQRRITSFTSLPDYPNMARVSKGFYTLANAPDFWLNVNRKHYPEDIDYLRRTVNLNWNKSFQPDNHASSISKPSFAEKFHTIRSHKMKHMTLEVANMCHLIREGRDDEIDMTEIDVEDLNNCDADGDSALMLAASRGNQRALDTFYRKAVELFQDDDNEDIIHPEYVDDVDQTILHWAAICKQPVNDIAALLVLGCDVTATDNVGWTPLHHAAYSGHLAAIDLLIEHHANPDAMCANHETPLHFAAEKGHIPSIVSLIKHGATIDLSEENGKTPLQAAAMLGQHEAVKTLLVHGAKIDMPSQNKEKYTALHYAAKNGRLETLKTLLIAGADPTIRSSEGYTALELALYCGHHECADYLIGHNNDVAKLLSHDGLPMLSAVAGYGYRNCIDVLLNRGANVNEISSSETHSTHALQQAAIEGHVDCLQLLLDAGAHVNLQAKDGQTALHSAAQCGRPDCVQLLLSRGANPDCQEQASGMTPLMMAAKAGARDCIKLLLDHGADINKRSFDPYWPALFFAVINNHYWSVRLLHKRGADINIEVKRRHVASQNTNDNSYGLFRIFAIARKMIGERTTMTAEEYATMLEHKHIASYLENARRANIEAEIDSYRIF